MTTEDFLASVRDKDAQLGAGQYIPSPNYNPSVYYRDVATNEYFKYLAFLRHHIKRASDYYMGDLIGALNVDLFMLTPSISSPVGPGSDSEAIRIKFGNLDTYLVDSSQFGFEPLLLNGMESVYCYLPSMRGEDTDDRHLSQFFHCELEIAGPLQKLMPIGEGYVRMLASTLLAMPNALGRLSEDLDSTTSALARAMGSFGTISFDKAYDTLLAYKQDDLVSVLSSGRSITPKGEEVLMREIKAENPVWVTNYDRDAVPFYQKPDPNCPIKAINADLIFPPILPGGFAGEILGSGQRQDTPAEIRESLDRQQINPEPYEWYIALRELSGYRTTSGFGLGVERFIAWALGKRAIRDVILYPRLKNIQTIP